MNDHFLLADCGQGYLPFHILVTTSNGETELRKERGAIIPVTYKI